MLPIDISSERLDAYLNENYADLEGNVKIRQGDMRLGAEKIHVEYLEKTGDIKEAIAQENVTIVHGASTATGDKAKYTPETESVLLTGNVVLTRGGSIVKGEKLLYDVKTGHMSLVNEKEGGRVKATFSLKGKK